MNKEIPVFYLYLHSKIKENSEGNEMSVANMDWYLFQWRIPSQLKPIIIKEMENMGLIEKVDKKTVKFLHSNFDIEDLRKVKKKLGIF